MGWRASGSGPALSGSIPAVRSLRRGSRQRRLDDYVALPGNRQQLWDGDDRLPLRRHGDAARYWAIDGAHARGPGQASVRAEDLPASELARGPETAGKTRVRGVVESQPRSGETIQQARGLSRSAGES